MLKNWQFVIKSSTHLCDPRISFQGYLEGKKNQFLGTHLRKFWPKEDLSPWHTMQGLLVYAQPHFLAFLLILVIPTQSSRNSLLFLKFNVFSLSHQLAHFCSCLIPLKDSLKSLMLSSTFFLKLLNSKS